MPELHFTKRALEAIRPDSSKRLHFIDDETQHLELIVTPSGVKTFYLYRRIGGEPSRVKIGRFPTTTLDQARRKMGELNGIIAAGNDPRDRLRASRAELTLSGAFKEFYKRHALPRKRSHGADLWMFEKYCGPLKNKRLSAIKARDVHALHSRVGEESGQAQANRLLTLLRALFNKCITWGLLDGANPAKGVVRFREVGRERFIQPEEAPKFFGAVAAEPDRDVADFVLLALLTGARKSNVLGMRWADIRLEVGDPTWTIPADDAKAGEPITVPLVPEAVEILRARVPEEDPEASEEDQNPWVFPKAGRAGHLIDVRPGWLRIITRAGVKDLRLHDLRRSLGSWQLRTGATLSVIGKSLGHRSVATTALYARLNVDPVRESMTRAVSALYAASEVEPKGKVHDITGARAVAKRGR